MYVAYFFAAYLKMNLSGYTYLFQESKDFGILASNSRIDYFLQNTCYIFSSDQLYCICFQKMIYSFFHS